MVSEARRQLKGIVEEIASRTSFTGDAEIMEIANTWKELYGRFFRKYGVWFESKGRMDAIEQAGYMEQITEVANDMLDGVPVFRYEQMQSEQKTQEQTDIGQFATMITEGAEKCGITVQRAMAILFDWWEPGTKLVDEYTKAKQFHIEIERARDGGYLEKLRGFTKRFFERFPRLNTEFIEFREYLRGEEGA